MPNYTYKCNKCNAAIVEFRTVADRHTSKKCSCGGKLVKVIESPMLAPMFKPYVNHALDVDPIYIKSKSQERDEYQKRGVFK